MAFSCCGRCLLRQSKSVRLPSGSCLSAPTRSFSTSAPFAASPLMKQKPSNAPPPRKGGKTLKIKRKVVARPTGRPPAPGERKALRKRVVLSNPNALEVPGLEVLTKETTVDESYAGKLIVLPTPLVDQLWAAGAFKHTQAWSSFRKPALLLTGNSVRMAKEMEDIEGGESRRTMRRVLTGDRGVGKSMLLLQAMAFAFLRDWVVINIPECQDITIAHTAYAPLPQTSPLQYVQKDYTASLLSQIAKANGPTLSRFELSQQHPVPIPLQPNLSLARLAEIGGSDPDVAWPIFQALWRELTRPLGSDVKRPPILLVLDGIGHLMRHSHYRDAEFNLIHSHDLALVRHFTSYLSGADSLPFGGAVLAATSVSNNPPAPTLSLVLRQLEARASGSSQIPQPSPFDTLDERVVQVMQSVEGLKLLGLTKHETRTLLEYYAASGVLRERVDQANVAEKWTLAGGGIIGEIERGAFGMRA